MSLIGTINEIILYGLMASIACLSMGRISFQDMVTAANSVTNFTTFYQSFLLWTTLLFIPVAIIGAFSTKYLDSGEGLTFTSNNIVVIIFCHIAEDLMGLFLTPFWFLKDLITHEFTAWKVVDYVLYAIEIDFLMIGFFEL